MTRISFDPAEDGECLCELRSPPFGEAELEVNPRCPTHASLFAETVEVIPAESDSSVDTGQV